MLRFLIRAEGRPDRTVEVSGDLNRAGSDPELPLHLEDTAADRRHFSVEMRDVGVVLKHMSPTGETRVNGQVVSQVRLNVGDLVEVGATQVILEVVAKDGAEAAPAAPAPAHAAPATDAATPAGPGAHAGPRRPPMPRTRASRHGPSAATSVLVLLLLVVGAAAAYLLFNRPKPKPRRSARLPEKTAPEQPDPARVVGAEIPPLPELPSGLRPEPIEMGPIPVLDEPEVVENTPDPDPVSIRPVPPDPRPDPEEAARRERERLAAEARARLLALEENLSDRISEYSFTGPIADAEALATELPEATGLLGDLRRAESAFASLKREFASGGRRVSVGGGLTVQVTGADDEGFDGKVGSATLRKKWKELTPETVIGVLIRRRLDEEDWLDLSAFAHLFGLAEDSETALVQAVKRFPTVKPKAHAVLARRRGVEVPDGGFVVHKGEWLTPEEKGYIDQGLIRHEGRWMTKDEVMAAKGYVKHEGRWLSPEDYEEVLEAEREVEELAKKYMPKGLIDKPGTAKASEWKDARVLKSGRYKIKTNLGSEVAKDIAYTMGILRTNLKSVFGLTGRGSRFTINVCADRAEYKTIWPRAGMSLGFCSSNEICTFYQPPMTTSVLMHEGVHEIVRWFEPNCPRWLHEGLATYYECSQFEFDPKKRRVNLKVGLLNAMRLSSFQREYKAGRYVPLAEFMSGKGGNPYTEGWAFVYYLAKAKDGKYARKLHTFIEEAHKNDVVERFKKIFRVKDLAVFEEEWLTYIKGLNPADGVTLKKAHR